MLGLGMSFALFCFGIVFVCLRGNALHHCALWSNATQICAGLSRYAVLLDA